MKTVTLLWRGMVQGDAEATVFAPASVTIV